MTEGLTGKLAARRDPDKRLEIGLLRSDLGGDS